MTKADDKKTPVERPAPLAADHPGDPRNKPPEELHPADLAAYVRRLPTRELVEGVQRDVATLLDRLAQLEPLGPAHAELASIVDGQAGELSQIHELLEGIAAELRARGALRPRVEGQARELPPEIQIDPSKEGTTVTELPGGGVLEVNVRRPVGGAAVIRDGKPVVPGKVRRS